MQFLVSSDVGYKPNVKIGLGVGAVFLSLTAFFLSVSASLGWFDDMRSPLSGSPRLVLWAWERPESLMFINPQKTSVAFLVRRLRYENNGTLTVVPRHQLLRVPEQTYLTGVCRLESPCRSISSCSDEVRKQIIAEVMRIAAIPYLREIQIDFDAREDERAFYESLLRDIRAKVPGSMKLSITALASWCLNDRWAQNLPVDESVAMLFRMGKEYAPTVRALNEAGSVKCAAVTALGFSVDEMDVAKACARAGVRSSGRIYLFDPNPWNEETLKKALRTVKDSGISDQNLDDSILAGSHKETK